MIKYDIWQEDGASKKESPKRIRLYVVIKYWLLSCVKSAAGGTFIAERF